MTSRKNIGGPKTAQGKLKVAKNATKHGLSSIKPTDANELALIQSFTQELIDFYKPASPLETFQIERIAMCRAKLARLYEVESVRLQLAQQELINDSKKIINELVGVDDVTKGMLREQINYGACTLPLGMKPATLEKIAAEITLFSGRISNEHAFARSFPQLTVFLNALIGSDQSAKATLEIKLIQVSERIERIFKDGNKYHEHFRPLIEELAQFKIQKEQSKKHYTQEEIDELDEYNQWREEERDADRVAHQKPPPLKPEPPPAPPSIFTDHEKVMKCLRWFTQLWASYQGLGAALEQFEATQDLMLRAISLPAQESDLLMRYQTTLERRLSVTIGEFLELQKLK